LTGEEIDIDQSQTDQDSPLLWIRCDPDCFLIRQCKLKQPDYCLQYQVRYERDVIGQVEALNQLIDYPTANTVKALKETIESLEYFWRVRCHACEIVYKVANRMASPDSGKEALFKIFNHFYCLSDQVSKDRIPRRNDFSNIQQYFVQCELPAALAKIRMSSGMAPQEISKFIQNLIKFNDNTKNAYLDCYWKAKLVESLTNTLSRGVQAQKLSVAVDEAKCVITEVIRVMNLEWLLPTYKHVTFIAALHAVRKLQREQHIPASSTIFIRFSKEGNFSDVRIAAIQCLIDFIKIEKSNGIREFEYLLKIVKNDNESLIRYKTLRLLAKNPPFKKMESTLNTSEIRNLLWEIISQFSACDSNVRCAAIHLWKLLYSNHKFDENNEVVQKDKDRKDKKAKKRYERALKLLVKANKEKPNKPDTLNYLGFTS
jgi:transcription initiation factor TFIID subunit 2